MSWEKQLAKDILSLMREHRKKLNNNHFGEQFIPPHVQDLLDNIKVLCRGTLGEDYDQD